MPFDISFETNLRAWTESLRGVERKQLPFATAKALTDTAKDVKAEHIRLLPLIFDKPTRFTMNSLQITPANKYTLVASVWFKQSTRAKNHYLMPQVEGGIRPHKRFEQWLIRRGLMESGEFAVPARGVKLDASGNLSAGTIVQILSQLAASPDASQWETLRSRKRAGAARARYFVPQRGSALPRGVWRRSGRTIAPVLLFVGSATYQARYAFHGLSRTAASARMPINFARAWASAIATAR